MELEEVHQTIVCSLVSVLYSLLDEIEKLANEIGKEFKCNPAHDIFSSLPTGELTAARLNGELGSDGTRYPTREYVQAAAGTAPVTRRSGKQCAWARQYFAEQMRLGHKPSRAYRALANGWAAIIWKMLQERECFNQSRLGKSQVKALSAV